MYRIDQGISMGKEYSNREELLKTAQNALHIPFGELDKTNRLHSVKGGIGQTRKDGFGRNDLEIAEKSTFVF